MYQMMINRKNSKKGFTLVEVIVVLVILAILAAIMIPAMTGWIDKAKEKSVVVEARSALLAAQTLVSEMYADGTTNTAPEIGENNGDTNTILGLAGVDGEVSNVSVDGVVVKGLTYANDKYSATWDGTTWEVTKK